MNTLPFTAALPRKKSKQQRMHSYLETHCGEAQHPHQTERSRSARGEPDFLPSEGRGAKIEAPQEVNNMKNNETHIAQAAQEQTGNRAPVKRIRLNGVQISIWCDPYEHNDGTTRQRWTAILDRSYIDATGTRKYTKTLSVSDMTDAIYAMQKAVAYIIEEKEQKQQEALANARHATEQHEVEIEAVTAG